MIPNSEILIRHVGINPTRDGILRVCRDMGADLTIVNASTGDGEPTADILVRSSDLHGTVIGGAIIPTLIDELPMSPPWPALQKARPVIKERLN